MRCAITGLRRIRLYDVLVFARVELSLFWRWLGAVRKRARRASLQAEALKDSENLSEATPSLRGRNCSSPATIATAKECRGTRGEGLCLPAMLDEVVDVGWGGRLGSIRVQQVGGIDRSPECPGEQK